MEFHASMSQSFHASMSQSFQASVALVQQQQKFDSDQQQQHQERRKGIGFCTQVLLVSALSGVEMCKGFEQIYEVLILQYLGVPKSLLTIHGVIVGTIMIFSIPTLGVLTDRSSNPRRRKRITLFIGTAILLLGFLFLAICGFIKIMAVKEVLKQHAATTNSSLYLTSTDATNWDETLQNEYSVMYNASTLPYTNRSNNESSDISESNTLTTVIMSIMGFFFLDVGFDMNMSLTRAYVLECSPKFMHLKLLVMATVMQSVSGLSLAFIGIWDIAGVLGPFFNVDGTAAVLIFFCIFLVVVITTGCLLTTLTGYFLTRESQELGNEAPVQGKAGKHPSKFGTPDNRRIKKQNQSQNIEQQKLKTTRRSQNTVQKEDMSSLTMPLLQYESDKDNDYSSMAPVGTDLDGEGDTKNNSYSTDGCCLATEKLQRARPDNELLRKVNRNLTETIDDVQEDVTDAGDKEPSSWASDQDLCSTKTSSSPYNSLIDWLRSKVLTQLEKFKSSGNRDIGGTQRTIKKKLAMLCVSTFFSCGSLLCFFMFSGNALTIGILHGDPLALPGTEPRELYEEGLRKAAMGTLTMNFAYTILSVCNKKVIDLIGENAQFIICHLLFITSLLCFVLSKREEVYFVSMATTGILRTTVFTLPFILANKFSQINSDNSNSSRNSVSLGKVMSLIGVMIPSQELVYSSVMGPLLGATGDVWMPMFYSLFCSIAAILAFVPFFFIK